MFLDRVEFTRTCSFPYVVVRWLALAPARLNARFRVFVCATRNTLYCFQRLTPVFCASVVTFVASRGVFHALGSGVTRVSRTNRALGALYIARFVVAERGWA
jgi:hypothetical protein